MVRDPVCGAQVNDQGVAWHTQYRRRLYVVLLGWLPESI